MSAFENIMQSAADKLLEDERLRANLADDEAKLLVNWAIEWLKGHMAEARSESAARQVAQAELARLRLAMQTINDLMAEGKTPSLATALKELRLPTSAAASNSALDRTSIIRILSSRLAERWSKMPSSATARLDKSKKV